MPNQEQFVDSTGQYYVRVGDKVGSSKTGEVAKVIQMSHGYIVLQPIGSMESYVLTKFEFEEMSNWTLILS